MLVIQTIIILCILIFVHELGHFAAAKLSGVKVNEFALGMGPAFFKKQRGETLYSLRILPIGGFCTMEGQDGDSDDSGSFEMKPARIRAIILAAGSFMNVALAILILSAVFFVGTALTTEIRAVGEGSPAEAAGIISGDRIVSVDGVPIGEWQEIVTRISDSQNERVSIGVIRNDVEMTIVTGTTTADDGRRIIGIVPASVTSFTNPFTAIALGTRAAGDLIVSMIEILGMIFTGAVPPSDLVGPIGIAYIVDDTARMGMRPLLFLVALISLNLAIVNLLPFPALDGGRLLFLVIRKLTGKVISDTVEGRIHLIGMVLLLALMVYLTWNDIGRFIIGTFTFG